MNGWLMSYKNIDHYQNFTRTYRKEGEAYEDAAESIKGWAKEEIENLQGQDSPEDWEEHIEHLKETLSLIEQKKFKEAYEEWREYADDADPGEDILIEDTEIV